MHKDIIYLIYFVAEKGFRKGDFYWLLKHELNDRLIGPQYGADDILCYVFCYR